MEATDARDAVLATPFGAICLGARLGRSRIQSPAHAVERVDGAVRVMRWRASTFQATLAIASLRPELPEGMAIQGCEAAAWCVAATRRVEECVFDARWADSSALPEGGPSSGQALAAITWEDARTVVTLGAPDAEALARYERAGLRLPVAWRAAVLVRDPSSVLLEDYLPDGLRLRLPGLEAGERGYAHFAVAWSETGEHDAAPWFAVDLGPAQLRMLLDAAV